MYSCQLPLMLVSCEVCCSAAVPSCALFSVGAVLLCSDVASSGDVPLFCATSLGSSSVKNTLLRNAAKKSPSTAIFELQKYTAEVRFESRSLILRLGL